MLSEKMRNLLYLNSMSFEMLVKQGRMWELTNRNLGGYCQLSCSIFSQSEENKIVEIEPGKNICYCIRNPSEKIKISTLRYIYRFFCLFILAFRLLSICKKNRITAIISQSNALRDLEIASLIASKLLNIPFFAYIGRNSTSLKKNRGLLERLIFYMEATILSCSDKVILRPRTEEVFVGYYKINPSKIVTIPHITRFHKLIGISEMPGNLKDWIADKKVILYYGRLEEDKLVEDIVESFHVVRGNYNDVCLLLIGFGKERKKLELLVNRIGLNSSVRFEASMPQEKLADISIKTHVHVHPTGGKGLLESAMLGRPVITYDSYSYDYGLVEHMKTGLKARFRDFESIAECIEKYLGDHDLGIRLGNALREKAFTESDLIVVQKRFSTAIEQVIMKKHAHRSPHLVI